LHTLFLENKVQINKNNNYTMTLFMSKQVSQPKISLILQKKKNWPKCYIRPFSTKAFNFQIVASDISSHGIVHSYSVATFAINNKTTSN